MGSSGNECPPGDERPVDRSLHSAASSVRRLRPFPLTESAPCPSPSAIISLMNRLYYGDNLPILRRYVRDESVDLVYLDPPFNSNRSYNVLFKSKSGDAAQAQIEAFDDTWTWSQDSETLFDDLVIGGTAPAKVADALVAMRQLLGDNDVLAYLVMMSARLIELHRVLKPTGSLYLHCDPTASHYLKIILDAVFGPTNFRNEIVWKRKAGRGETQNAAIRFGVTNDIILFYAKSPAAKFKRQYRPNNPHYIASKFTHVDPDSGRRYRLDNITSPSYRPNLVYEYKGYSPPPNGWAVSRERMEQMDAEGRLYLPDNKDRRIQRKRYLDELEGETVDSLWDDISPINSQAAERLGYPTQKPVALLERILAASTEPGDLVLDPFCGCGTTIDAAQKMGRRWIGVDITYLAIDLIQKRLIATYGAEITGSYELTGVPRELEGAQAMFDKNPFDFERWAVSLVSGQPNEKQVGDRGIDGVIRFHRDEKSIGQILVSVKGGRQLDPSMVRDLGGTVQSRKADMGLLVCLGRPTRGMIEEADHSGSFRSEFTGTSYPRIQIVTIADLLAGRKPRLPTPIQPYRRARPRSRQLTMLDDD